MGVNLAPLSDTSITLVAGVEFHAISPWHPTATQMAVSPQPMMVTQKIGGFTNGDAEHELGDDMNYDLPWFAKVSPRKYRIVSNSLLAKYGIRWHWAMIPKIWRWFANVMACHHSRIVSSAIRLSVLNFGPFHTAWIFLEIQCLVT